jgi:3-phenylpropionate/trans-cinnamate dioxygenase ferredoxin subunit
MTQNFVEVATASELAAGRMKCIAIGGRRLLLANVEGRFCAVEDNCTHEDASLSTGVLTGDLVRCPLHGSRFNVCTGEVLEEPAELNLRTYPVRIEGDRVLVDLAADSEP